jgi:hypothetical protein
MATKKNDKKGKQNIRARRTKSQSLAATNHRESIFE